MAAGGMLERLIEDALITWTGEYPIAAGDDAAAGKSLQDCVTSFPLLAIEKGRQAPWDWLVPIRDPPNHPS